MDISRKTLMAGAALTAACALALWLAWDWIQTPAETKVMKGGVATAPKGPAGAAPAGKAGAAGAAAGGGQALFRCETAQGVEYRNSPCPGGAQQSKVDVVVPQGMTFAPGAAAAGASGAAGGAAPAMDAKTRSERCTALAVKLANVDKELAQPNAAQGAAWLREERGRITAERGKLGCI
jgi:hypothetical protein